MINKIIFFFDFTCPFSYIGFSYLNTLAKDYNIEVMYLPFITHSNIPPNGIKYEKLYENYKDIKVIYDYSKSLAVDNNIELDIFSKKFSSYLATLYLFYANEKGMVQEYIKLVFENVFIHNKNVGKDTTIKQIYKTLKLNFNEATKLINNGNYLGYGKYVTDEMMKYNTTTVPTFVINNKVIIGIHNLNMYKLYLTQ